MANANRPSGLSPIEYINGAPWTGKGRVYYIPSSDGSAFAVGDPVALAGSSDANGVPTIALATAGSTNKVLGSILSTGGAVFGGGMMIPGSLETTVIPATKTRGYYVAVCDDPWVIYGVQEGGAGAALTAVDVGQNANLLSGTNSGYQSGWLFDNASLGSGATIQLQLLGLVNSADNAFGAYAKWKVRINVHQFVGGVAGV